MKVLNSLLFIFFLSSSICQSMNGSKLLVFQGDIDSTINVSKLINLDNIQFYLIDAPFFEIEYLKEGYKSTIDTSDVSFPGMQFFIESFFDSIKMNRMYGLTQIAYQLPFYEKKLDGQKLNNVAEILNNIKCKSSYEPVKGLKRLTYDFSLPSELIDSIIYLFDNKLTPIQESFMRYYYELPDNEFGNKPNFWLCSDMFLEQRMVVFTNYIGPYHKSCYAAKIHYNIFIKRTKRRKRSKEVKKQFSVSKRKFKNEELIELENGNLLQVHYID